MPTRQMTELDLLPPDQRAVLSLVLNQGKSYREVADALRISEQTVRDRAHQALDTLAGHSPDAPTGHNLEQRGHTSPARSSAGAIGPVHASRRAGAVLLAVLVAVIVVAVILLSGGGGKGASPSASSTTTTSTSGSTSTSTSAAGSPTIDKRIALTATEAGSKASGVGLVLSEGSRRAFYVAAQNMPPSSGFFYAVWLYNSPSQSTPLGRAPTVGSNGRMEGGGALPSNAGSYHRLVVTRETSTHPTQPGPIVLSGEFALR